MAAILDLSVKYGWNCLKNLRNELHAPKSPSDRKLHIPFGQNVNFDKIYALSLIIL